MAFNFGYKMNPEREPLLLPGVPTDLTVVKQDDVSVLISWNAPIGGDVEATDYEYTVGDGGIRNTRGADSVIASTTPNIPVDYKVRSVSAEGGRSDWTDVVTYTNVVPQRGVDTTTGQVDIAFTDATNTVYWDGSQYIQEVVVDTPISSVNEISNGTFDGNDLTGWYYTAGQVNMSAEGENERLKLVRLADTSGSNYVIDMELTSGVTYNVTYDVEQTGITENYGRTRISGVNVAVYYDDIALTSEQFTYEATATGTHTFEINTTSNTGATFYIDNIVVSAV